MQNGICPKCSSKRIHVGSETPPGIGDLPITGFVAAQLVSHVCVDCGYVESYVTNRSKLRKIEQEWPRGE